MYSILAESVLTCRSEAFSIKKQMKRDYPHVNWNLRWELQVTTVRS